MTNDYEPSHIIEGLSPNLSNAMHVGHMLYKGRSYMHTITYTVLITVHSSPNHVLQNEVHYVNYTLYILCATLCQHNVTT